MTDSKWSFCVVTAKGNDAMLSQCLDSILVEAEQLAGYEVIVVGEVDANTRSKYPDIRFEKTQERYFSISKPRPKLRRLLKSPSIENLIDLFYKSGPISHKKNFAAQLARFENLCILHDYVGIEPGWSVGFDRFGYDWTICMTAVKNMDGSRYRDWCAWDYKNIGPGLLPYHVSIKEMYISGTYFCVKKDFFLANPLDQSLFWGEGEDVEWSIRVRELVPFNMNKNASVRFLKMKPKDQAPYDAQWLENERKLKEAFQR